MVSSSRNELSADAKVMVTGVRNEVVNHLGISNRAVQLFFVTGIFNWEFAEVKIHSQNTPLPAFYRGKCFQVFKQRYHSLALF
jgi:hypothetical protein